MSWSFVVFFVFYSRYFFFLLLFLSFFFLFFLSFFFSGWKKVLQDDPGLCVSGFLCYFLRVSTFLDYSFFLVLSFLLCLLMFYFFLSFFLYFFFFVHLSSLLCFLFSRHLVSSCSCSSSFAKNVTDIVRQQVWSANLFIKNVHFPEMLYYFCP